MSGSAAVVAGGGSCSPLRHILVQASKHGSNVAILPSVGGGGGGAAAAATTRTTSAVVITYADLCAQAKCLSKLLVARYGRTSTGSLEGKRIAIATTAGDVASTVVAHWAVWAAGGVAVPLPQQAQQQQQQQPMSYFNPLQQLRFMVQDSGACALVTSQENLESMESVVSYPTTPICLLEEAECDSNNNNDVDWNLHHLAPGRISQILYTTEPNRPRHRSKQQQQQPAGQLLRGVVHTHQTLTAQIQVVVDAWQITEYDRVVVPSGLSCMPQNYVTSILHPLWVPLYAGATLYTCHHDNSHSLDWTRVGQGTVLLGVGPEIYQSLLYQYQHKSSRMEQDQARRAAQRLRLCTLSSHTNNSTKLQQQWNEQLLRGGGGRSSSSFVQYYGTTPEVGTICSTSSNNAKFVQQNQPQQQYSLLGRSMSNIIQLKLEGPYASQGEGELCVKGHTVFHSYWNDDITTSSSSSTNNNNNNKNEADNAGGWFRTGDWMQQVQDSLYRFLGRYDVDLVKVNPYQTISCLDVEHVLSQNQHVLECHVVGVPSNNNGGGGSGMVLTAIIRLHPDILTKGQTIYHAYHMAQEDIQRYAYTQLEEYQVPQQYQFWDTIPKHEITGEVDKHAIVQMITDHHHHQQQSNNPRQRHKLGLFAALFAAAGAYLTMPLSIP